MESPTMGLSATARSAASRKLWNSFLEEERLGQTEPGQMIGWRCLDGTPRRSEPGRQGIRLKVECLSVLVGAQDRKHGPGLGVSRRFSHRRFQTRSRRGKLFYGGELEVTEAAQDGFVGAQLLGRAAANSFTHAPGQDAVHVGDRRDDPRNQLVLELENGFRAERALVVLGPEMRAG